jgi:membrane protease YdiL (CAAX protease family)
VKVGPSYIYVDWAVCDACGACVEVCDPGAIAHAGLPARSTANPRGGLPEAARTTAGTYEIPFGAEPPRPGLRERMRTSLTPEGGDSPWTFGDLLTVLVVAAVLLVSKDLAMSSPFARSLTVRGLVLLRTGSLLAYYGALFVVLVAIARWREVDFREAFGLVRFRVLSSALWVLAALIAARAISTMYGAVAQAAGWEPPTGTFSELTTVFGPDALGLGLAIAMVVAVGPFVEELVFRGMVLSVATDRFGVGRGVVASALLFALSHVTLWAFLPLAVLGVILGYLRVTRGSIWPSIALHALYNAMAVVAAFYVAGVVGR